MPKAFVELAGRPLLEWAVEVLRELCDRIVIAVPAGYEDGRDRVVGGPSRSASVRNALAAAPEARVAVIHDAARPLVTRDLVGRCIEGARGADGAIAAAPVTDTIKQTGGDGFVRRTLDRSSLWAIQTPQVFEAAVLRRALEVEDSVLAQATDDAWLVERSGGTVRLVEAPRENLKVTTPLDLQIAEALLASPVLPQTPLQVD